MFNRHRLRLREHDAPVHSIVVRSRINSGDMGITSTIRLHNVDSLCNDRIIRMPVPATEQLLNGPFRGLPIVWPDRI